MKSIIKTLLFGMFLFGTVGVKAQEASGGYEFAKVFDLQAKYIAIVYSNGEVEKVPFEKVTDVAKVDQQFLQTVEKLTSNGWTLITINSEGVGRATYYLKRKKK